MKLKYDKRDLPLYSQVIFNCILSCNNLEQLETVKEMISNLITKRFKLLVNEAELTLTEYNLNEVIKDQKRYIDHDQLPTLSRYLN